MGIWDYLTVPFAWIMNNLYMLFNNYFLALIIYALIIKIVLFPMAMKQQKNSLQMARMRPMQDALQKKYGSNKEKYNQELQKLYQREGYNPMSSCLPLLIQLPLIFIIYSVVRHPLSFIKFGELFSANAAQKVLDFANTLKLPETLMKDGKSILTLENVCDYELQIMGAADGAGISGNTILGINLSATPSFTEVSWLWVIPILAGVTGFLVSWLSQKLNGNMNDQQQGGCSPKLMTYMMPLMSLYFCFIMPCSLGVYWIIGNILSIGQTFLLHRMYNPQKAIAEVEAKLNHEKEVKKAKRSAAAEKKAAALAAGKKKNK